MDSIDLHVLPSLADPSISPQALTTIDLLERAVDADQEDIERLQNPLQVSSPCRKLDDVLNDEPACRSRSSARYSLRASGLRRSQGSNQCRVRELARIG